MQSANVHRNRKMTGDLRPAGSKDKAVSKTRWEREIHITCNMCKNMGFKTGRPDPLQHCMETDCNTIPYGIYSSWQHTFQDTWTLPECACSRQDQSENPLLIPNAIPQHANIKFQRI